MTQITLAISDPKEASLIKKLLAKLDSVVISKPVRRRKTGLVEAAEELHCDNLLVITNSQEEKIEWKDKK